MNIAFFDFDGTISKRDSMIDFIIYSAGYKKFITGMFLSIPDLVKYKLGLLQNWQAKERIMGRFFGGWDSSVFDEAAYSYSVNRLPLIIRDIARQAIETHKNNGDRVVVVSASSEKWLKPWCDSQGIELIGTIFEVENGVFTGKISGKNCYGEEKVNRIRKSYNPGDYEKIYAYGDSSGDLDMLNLAHVKYYKWQYML